MARKVVQIPKTVPREAISSTKQTGTKDSPILLLSDDEIEGKENNRRSLTVAVAPQKAYLGVSPSDNYTFTGHGSAYDIMIAMGYKPDRGLGPTLRGSATSRSAYGVSVTCLFSARKHSTSIDRTPEAQGWSRLSYNLPLS